VILRWGIQEGAKTSYEYSKPVVLRGAKPGALRAGLNSTQCFLVFHQYVLEGADDFQTNLVPW
jgi:hypothetical protein